MHKTYLLLLAVWLCLYPGRQAAAQASPVAAKVAAYEAEFRGLFETQLLQPQELPASQLQKMQKTVSSATYYQVSVEARQALLQERPAVMRLPLQTPGGQVLMLRLYQAKIFSEDYQLSVASRKGLPQLPGTDLHYWGIVEGAPKSLAAVSVSPWEVMGMVAVRGQRYTLGKLQNDTQGLHIFYEDNSLQTSPSFGCSADEIEQVVAEREHPGNSRSSNPDNCVRMYVEADYDIYVDKGSVAATESYVSGLFSQAAILFANENINLVTNEIFVWDTEDPYTGPSTSNYLTQFRDYLSGNFNGDLAHLVGYGGGGGVAYLDVLCFPFYSVAYSGINSTYQDVPTYSWSVMVVTHEIGHNLGSPHTHACAWNGDDTAIDSCGPEAGYSEGCDDAPLPNAGTIMSYCHLVGGVGIDLNLGFGPQPGDLIRSEVYNASCLSPCGISLVDDAGISSILQPVGTVCGSGVIPEVVLTNYGTSTLSSVIIEYQVNNGPPLVFNWSGTLDAGLSVNVLLPGTTFGFGSQTFTATTSSPNGNTDNDPSNDSSTSNFTSLMPQTYYADNDGDGYGDPNDSVSGCTLPQGYTTNSLDCDDSDATIYPDAACDDGDDCTVNDIYDSDCNCSGTFEDADNDTVCDADDVCDGFDDTLIGTSCDDGDPCTENDEYTTDCDCAGTFADADDDGVCDADDVCANFDDALIGTACDDGDPCTVNDEYTSDCECVGTFEDADDDGVCDAEDICPNFDDALIGTPCDDGDACTINDQYTTDCECAGTFADEDSDGVCDADDICPSFDDNLIGTPCDDGDPCTINDAYTTDCDCVGIFADDDNDGVCNADDQCANFDDNLIGTPCDDGNPCTINDEYTTDCDCAGTYTDSDNDGVCDAEDQCDAFDDALIGTACDDGNDCTINDIYTSNCECEGTPTDTDSDGVCDADDSCPGFDDTLIGTPCDDGDPCTINDEYTTDCDCAGTYADSDGDGFCDGEDVCPNFDDNLIGTPCDDGNDCTVSDVYTTNCECEGTPIDSDNDGVCDADDVCPDFNDNLIGTVCDDGDPCTENDLYTANCNCAGTLIDSDNDGICDADDDCPNLNDDLIGTPCDDGNDCTVNDVYTEDCGCVGTSVDADNDGICDGEDVCPDLDDNLIGTPCDDGNECTEDDTYTEDCECAGTPVDSDSDGVCDADDVCPGGDDLLDEDEDGLPDECECISETDTFEADPLQHQGAGSSSVVHTLPHGSFNPVFEVAKLNARLLRPENSFIDLVTVSYTDGNGDPHHYGSYSGDTIGQVDIAIIGQVSSITIELQDGFDGEAPFQLSVNLSEISYCDLEEACNDPDEDGICDQDDDCPDLNDELIGQACDDGDPCTEDDVYGEDCACAGTFADQDGDGVCDAEDLCPGGDDTVDDNENGVPDDCEGCREEIYSYFFPSTLTHSGPGISFSFVSLPAQQTDASFTISGLDAAMGNVPQPYIDRVQVLYVDGSGSTQLYGTFNGLNQSTVQVDIPGPVSTIVVMLSNGFGAHWQSSQLSVELSPVKTCNNKGASLAAPAVAEAPAATTAFGLELYPNPTQGEVTLELEAEDAPFTVILRDMLGAVIATRQLSGSGQHRLPVKQWANGNSGCYFLTVQKQDGQAATRRLIITR